MNIVFATGNYDKLRELKDILAKKNCDKFHILSLKDLNLSLDVEENGSTYEENAMIKASKIYENIKDSIIIADDSGLEIEALNGEPGIYSARYMGTDTSYILKNQSLINRLNKLSMVDRSAKFVCAIAIIFPNGTKKTVRGEFYGTIAKEIKGENGFGYDPIFYLPEYGCTSAQITPELKNRISHRAIALNNMLQLKEFKSCME